MVYKPKTQTGGFGPRGQAKISISPDRDKVKVTLREAMDDGEIKEHKAVLNIDDCPAQVQNGMWFASLSSDLSKMYDIHPWSGMFEAHTKAFASKKDQPPAPQVRSGAYGEYAVFVAILELVGGDVDGMTAGYQLPYNFFEAKEEIKGELKSVVGISHPKSKFTEKLQEYLEASGAWEKGPMPFSDNILPNLEKRILREDRHFKVIFQKGYITSLYADDALPESEDAEEESKE